MFSEIYVLLSGLDQTALATEARITPLIHEKKMLFNDLLTLKGISLCSLLPGLLTSFTYGVFLVPYQINNYQHLAANVKVFCRSRSLFEDEGPSVIEFPDDFTIRVNTGDESLTNPKKDYEFDRVYGPHTGQGKIGEVGFSYIFL